MGTEVVVGSVAEWGTFGATVLAAGAAVTALWFSARANALAKRVYADDVKVRTEAQARAVYSTIEGYGMYEKGSSIPHPEGEWSMSQVGGGNLLDSIHTETFAREDLMILDVLLHNESSELIGPFQISVFDMTDRVTMQGSIGAGMIRPGESSGRIRIAMPRTEHRLIPEIAFRDSAGTWWNRIYYEPVQLLDSDRVKLYSSMPV